jgi:hypothetical protein
MQTGRRRNVWTLDRRSKTGKSWNWIWNCAGSTVDFKDFLSRDVWKFCCSFVSMIEGRNGTRIWWESLRKCKSCGLELIEDWKGRIEKTGSWRIGAGRSGGLWKRSSNFVDQLEKASSRDKNRIFPNKYSSAISSPFLLTSPPLSPNPISFPVSLHHPNHFFVSFKPQNTKKKLRLDTPQYPKHTHQTHSSTKRNQNQPNDFLQGQRRLTPIN